MSRPERVRREFATALATTLAGAAVLLAAASQTWADFEVSAAGPSAAADGALTGDDVAPVAAAAGWAALAALAALLAARGWARRGLGVLLAGFAAVALYDLWSGTRPGALARAAADHAQVGDPSAPALHTGWPLLAVLGALLLLGAGVATMFRGAAWPGMGSRYDRHSAPATVRSGEPAELWKSLDSGVDPTVDPAQEAGSDTTPSTASHDNADAKEP